MATIETTQPEHSQSPQKPAGTSAERKNPAKRKRGWSWSEINLLLDGLLLVVFVGLCIASVIVRFVFPPGPAAKDWSLWGLDYDAWGGVQFGMLAVLTVGILVHVMFHWPWVCNVLALAALRQQAGPGRRRHANDLWRGTVDCAAQCDWDHGGRGGPDGSGAGLNTQAVV